METISDLEITLDNLFNWFCYNDSKTNASKCHVFLSPFSARSINSKSSLKEGGSSEKSFGITIDSKLYFWKAYKWALYKKGNLVLHALTRCSKFVSTETRRLIFKSFIISQFNYCPLVWMLHTKQLNNGINSLHEKALRVTYQDRNSTLSELLNLDKMVSIQYRNIIYLLTETY